MTTLLLALLLQDYKGLTPDQAVAKMKLREGFKATVFAAEPDVRQPNAFCIDDRGRLWVTENFSYTGPGGPWKPSGKDTILIFEDTDGDGRHDKRTVFADNLSFVSGLELGFGGVWAGSPPNLLFIPDKNRDDKPDGPPQVVLDGWGHHDQHETLNSFIWGPDGWLYGCQGVFTHSRVGKPGTPDKERAPINGGYWRYHPTKQKFEVFAWGTSNPWGIDFDDHGQAIATACVIPHFYHVIQGARYQRQGGKHFNEHDYDDIKTIRDHSHEGIQGRKGGHAHGGCRINLGGNFGPEFRGKVFMGSIHHHGMYTDLLERKGSGFVGKHDGDFLMSNDPWFLGFNIDWGPDGGLYIIDWYNQRECHGQDLETPLTGRVYKVTRGDSARVAGIDAAATAEALVAMMDHENDWFVRHARRVLQERGPDPKVHALLTEKLRAGKSAPRQLRALWALHATGGLTEALAREQFAAESEYVRGWAIQLLCEDGKVSDAVRADFVKLAKEDPSPVVRLYLAAAMQRIPGPQRWEVLEALAAHAEDAQDHNLPLMVWWGLEPIVKSDAARAAKLIASSKLPTVSRFIPRRLASADPQAPKTVEPAATVSDEGLVLKLDRAAQPNEANRPVSESVAGRKALVFDGRNDHLVVAHEGALTFGKDQPFTLAAWVYTADLAPRRWQGIVTKSRDQKPWYGLWIDGDGSYVFGGPDNIHGGKLKAGWHHVCGVQAEGKRHLYVDGGLVASGEAQDGGGPGDVWIGGSKSVKEHLQGALDDVRIYRRGLSHPEVARLAVPIQ